MKINKVNKLRLLFVCFIIAIVVYVIADIYRQRSEAGVNVESIDGMKSFDEVVGNLVEVEYRDKNRQFLDDYHEMLEEERQEKKKAYELRLAREEEERLAKIEAEKVAAEKAEQVRLAKIEEDKKIAKQEKIVAKAEQPNRSGGTGRGRSLGTFQATAYCKCTTCCGSWSNSPTASGTTPREGRTIAVDKSIIPLGSRVSVNNKIYIAEDTGSAIKGRIIDIYFHSHQSALSFGRQNVTVKILD